MLERNPRQQNKMAKTKKRFFPKLSDFSECFRLFTTVLIRWSISPLVNDFRPKSTTKLSNISRKCTAQLSKFYRTSAADELSKMYQPLKNVSKLYRTSAADKLSEMYQPLKNVLTFYQTSIDNLGAIYRSFIEHISNIYRTHIANLSNNDLTSTLTLSKST